MTTPRSMSTSTDPPRGCGPAWGGPALGPPRPSIVLFPEEVLEDLRLVDLAHRQAVERFAERLRRRDGFHQAGRHRVLPRGTALMLLAGATHRQLRHLFPFDGVVGRQRTELDG